MSKRQEPIPDNPAVPSQQAESSTATNSQKPSLLLWKRFLPIGTLVILLTLLCIGLLGVQNAWDRAHTPQKPNQPSESEQYTKAKTNFDTAGAKLQKAEALHNSDQGDNAKAALTAAKADFQKAQADFQKVQAEFNASQQRIAYMDDLRKELASNSTHQRQWGILLVLATIFGMLCVNFLLHNTFSSVLGQGGNSMAGTGSERINIIQDERASQEALSKATPGSIFILPDPKSAEAIEHLTARIAELTQELREAKNNTRDPLPAKTTPSLEEAVKNVVTPPFTTLATTLETLRREFTSQQVAPEAQPKSSALPKDIISLPTQVAALSSEMEAQRQQSSDMMALLQLLTEQMGKIANEVTALSSSVQILHEQANRNASSNVQQQARPTATYQPPTTQQAVSGTQQNRAPENTLQNHQRNADTGGISSSSPKPTVDWQEELRAQLAAFDASFQQSSRKYKGVQNDREILEEISNWLVQKWPAFLARLEAGDTINLKSFLPMIDRALYLPLDEVLKTPSQNGEGNKEFGTQIAHLRSLLSQAQSARRAEMKRCGMERIEAPEGSARIYNNEWETDTEGEAPSAPRSDWAGKLCKVLPGKGGYRFKGGVVLPSYAVYYKS